MFINLSLCCKLNPDSTRKYLSVQYDRIPINMFTSLKNLDVSGTWTFPEIMILSVQSEGKRIFISWYCNLASDMDKWNMMR